MIQFDFYTLASVSSIMEQEENCGRLKDESYSQETKKISLPCDVPQNQIKKSYMKN